MAQTYVYNSGSYNGAEDGVIEIERGLFFDGTNNNHRNVEIRKKVQKIEEYEDQSKPENKSTWTEYFIYKSVVSPFDGSYENDFSNVARLWKGVDQEKYGIYIEGIGTKDEDGDYIRGMAWGTGGTGIRAKVRKGCKKLADEIKKAVDKIKKDKKEIKSITITLDVFGFSRGAAAARNFVYEIGNNKRKVDIKILSKTELTNRSRAYKYETVYRDKDGEEVDSAYLDNGKMPKLGYLGYYLLQKKLSKEDLNKIRIKIRFVGVYDTVASFDSEHSDDIVQLQLNNLGKPAKVVHFTAMDEHRKNFALSKIPEGANFIEKNFPGVHSDIGGGYTTDKKEEIIVEKNYSSSKECKKERDKLCEEYWYDNEQLSIHYHSLGSLSLDHSQDGGAYYYLEGRRKIKKEYSYIPLHFMEELFKETLSTKQNNIILKKSTTSYSISKDYSLIKAKKYLAGYVLGDAPEWKFIPDKKGQKFVPDRKGQLKKRILYVIPTEKEQILLRKLRLEYLHRSAKSNLSDSIAHGPAPNRKRPIIPPR